MATIAVDGVGDEYNKIRAPAKFDDLIEKLKKFKKIKEEKSFKPVIKVQTISAINKDNPDEYFSIFRPLVDQVTCNQLVDYLDQDDPEKLYMQNSITRTYQRMT